ncbi:helix-turn-helix transcriptional regulator [Desmospora profundinema]|uniref:AraC-like DNA-binding protein n=1 Tax=Desmospora profundinema TaxID=1571184 RepID=A0ABU1IH75_9BACL|nr:AraC family transcriptional regulator [Desmospora profundinema]MDR6224131.1 AraC-like DNA-binding protein [Desmospora profundinema]
MKWTQTIRILCRLDDPLLALHFCMEGQVEATMDGMKEGLSLLQAGHSHVLYAPQLRGVYRFPAGRRLSFATLMLNPKTFYAFAEPRGFSLPVSHPWDEHQSDSALLSPDTQMILHQIQNHEPGEGWIPFLYLESKCMELLALRLKRLWDKGESGEAPMGAEDLRQVEQACCILNEEMEDPPAVAELARRVCLNEWKLRRGFRQLYGTTVVRCLRDLRMERARRLLEETEHNVTEIACVVGYSHTSHFIASFKKKYGVTPKVYRSYRKERELS